MGGDQYVVKPHPRSERLKTAQKSMWRRKGLTFCKILEVSRTVDTKATKKAYRVHALKWHSGQDRNNREGADQFFLEMSQDHTALRKADK
jgi:DnaJ-class molecular chaperone